MYVLIACKFKVYFTNSREKWGGGNRPFSAANSVVIGQIGLDKKKTTKKTWTHLLRHCKSMGLFLDIPGQTTSYYVILFGRNFNSLPQYLQIQSGLDK